MQALISSEVLLANPSQGQATQCNGEKSWILRVASDVQPIFSRRVAKIVA